MVEQAKREGLKTLRQAVYKIAALRYDTSVWQLVIRTTHRGDEWEATLGFYDEAEPRCLVTAKSKRDALETLGRQLLGEL